jgi:hypothetical protein
MDFLDTQIISYAMKGREGLPIKGATISSISANELLLVQGTKYTQANYYVPMPCSRFKVTSKEPSHFNPSHRLSRMDHPFSRRSTDQVLLDFGNQYPTIIEYGNLAISIVINNKASVLFNEAIKFLPAHQRKRVRRAFDFIIDNSIRCAPLTKNSIAYAVDLLQKFATKHSFKGNFRNSLNDILILASAIDASAKLNTEDSLLGAFAAEVYNVPQHIEDGILVIDFSSNNEPLSKKKAESKGYINKGWQVKFKNYGNSLV